MSLLRFIKGSPAAGEWVEQLAGGLVTMVDFWIAVIRTLPGRYFQILFPSVANRLIGIVFSKVTNSCGIVRLRC
jgi:hypothetical protein